MRLENDGFSFFFVLFLFISFLILESDGADGRILF